MNKKHIIIYKLLRPLVAVFLWIKFGYTYKKAKNLPKTPYIVLSNHVTDFDPLFVGVSFSRQMYLVGSEHIARWKHAFKFLKFGFDPILRYKGTSAAHAILEVLRRVRKGANVCMFAEGVRSWDGLTNPIAPTTGQLIKSAKCALVTYKIVGGYFVSPMWSKGGTRKGYIHGECVAVYTKEQLAEMSVEEINEIIERDLHEDAYARQLESPKKYRGKQLAYKMESMLFTCPFCHAHESMYSEKNKVSCKCCTNSFSYDEYGMLHGLPFKTVKELSDWQKSELAHDVGCGACYSVEGAKISTVKNHKDSFVCKGTLTMNGEEIRCGELVIPVSEIDDLAMHGKYALVLSVKKDYYEILIPESSNALKFFLMYKELSVRCTELK